MYKKIAIIGGKDSILPFKGIGIDVFPVTSIDNVRQLIDALATEYAVIYITERVAEQVMTTISMYDTAVLPMIIPIPSSTGAIGIGMEHIAENVEKAVGQDIT